jgi:hypothetical protein
MVFVPESVGADIAFPDFNAPSPAPRFLSWSSPNASLSSQLAGARGQYVTLSPSVLYTISASPKPMAAFILRVAVRDLPAAEVCLGLSNNELVIP